MLKLIISYNWFSNEKRSNSGWEETCLPPPPEYGSCWIHPCQLVESHRLIAWRFCKFHHVTEMLNIFIFSYFLYSYKSPARSQVLTPLFFWSLGLIWNYVHVEKLISRSTFLMKLEIFHLSCLTLSQAILWQLYLNNDLSSSRLLSNSLQGSWTTSWRSFHKIV